MNWRLMGLVLALPLAACGTAEDTRYLIGAPALVEPAKARVGLRSVELRDVTLPEHASGTDVLFRHEDGALRPLGDAVWADDPERAVTGTLAQLLDARSSAVVAPEPWPLRDGPSARMTVRIDKMIASSTGLFEITGLAAIAGVEGRPRERVERFGIAVPLTAATAAAVTEAQGRALVALSDELVGLLR
ncbi:ABC-type transport auxiliary lipoprotein family protein [Marivita sp. GX14005]|uniref:PqiC family protein n=1 Tax=Marivita sp. GX14005 TaxID=2942276 RepID=UPI0020199AB9|nr:ABC-type transport auxiliary lipoprotein family protein [Marivita sp. GX14005]MCL3880786.1 PqiC family protein [Marivita sp. GX14005]